MKEAATVEAGLGHLSEADIIRKYIEPLSSRQILPLDCSDDAAVIDFPAGKMLVMTTDAVIEGTHFLSTDPPESIAKKALRVNLSDLAAMGAHPIGYTLCLSLNSTVTESWLARFFAGLGEDNHGFRISLLGGDLNKSDGPVHVSIAAFGDVAEGRAITRAGAQSGDRIYVTGTIGDAAVGLKVIQGLYKNLSESDQNFFTNRYRIPQPRVVMAQNLAQVVHAAIDVSDGLLYNLDLVCAASELVAYVRRDKIPLSKPMRRLLKDMDTQQTDEVFQSVMTGGDDYELIFTVSPGEADHIEYLSQRYNVPMTCIGHLGLRGDEDGNIVLVNDAGERETIHYKGYQHQW